MTDRFLPATALVGPPSLAVQGVVSTLVGAGLGTAARFETLAAFRDADGAGAVSLLLMVAFGQAVQAARDIATLRRQRPSLRIVALAGSQQDAVLFQAAGANAHVCLSDTPDVLVEAMSGQARPHREIPTAFHPTAGPDSLSSRELEVVDGIAQGLSNKLLARRLCIAEATVKAHVRAILKKTGATNRTQVALRSAGLHGLPARRPDLAPPVRPAGSPPREDLGGPSGLVG